MNVISGPRDEPQPAMFWDPPGGPAAVRVRACEEALASMSIERRGLMDEVAAHGARADGLERTITAAQGTIGMLEAERNAAHVLAEQRLTEAREAAEELGRGARELHASTAELKAGRLAMQDQRNHIAHLEARLAVIGYARTTVAWILAAQLVFVLATLAWWGSSLPMPTVDYTGPPDMTRASDYWEREATAGVFGPQQGYTQADPNTGLTDPDRATGSGELHRPIPSPEAWDLRVIDGDDNPGAILRHEGGKGIGAGFHDPEDVWECITHHDAKVRTCVGCGIAHGANSYRTLMRQMRNPPSGSAWVVRPEEPEANPNMAHKVDTSR